MALITSLVLTDRDSVERFVEGANMAGVYINGRPGGVTSNPLSIYSDDPDELDRVAAEIASAAESLRLARLAQFRTAS
jgi:hypothetical protein